MKQVFKQLYEAYRSSKILRPLTLFFLFWVLSAGLMAFFETGANEQFRDFLDGVWWSVITFSTTGYGDKVPSTVGGRIVAISTIFFGVAAMSFLSGSLASFFVERNARARRGLMDYRKTKGHLVICGWKDDMKGVLTDILTVAGDLTSEDLIAVSNVDSEKVESLKEDPSLKGLKFVKGDYFSEAALQRANVKAARKVLVMADQLESSTASEVDSRTVMTVLTIKGMSKTVYVAAEVLDRKYENYLRQARCDEVIFSRDFSRRILANTSASNGMAHILQELLSQHTSGTRLATLEIPSELVNQSFGRLREHLALEGRRLVLGVLENTGSPNTMKIESLREAQKTSDVSQLITNLQRVRDLEVNRPVLLPEDSYLVQRYSLAIVLEKLGAGHE